MRSAVNEGEYAYTLNFHVSVHQNTMVASRSDPSVQQPRRGWSVQSLEIAHTLVPVRDTMLTNRTRVQGAHRHIGRVFVKGRGKEPSSCGYVGFRA